MKKSITTLVTILLMVVAIGDVEGQERKRWRFGGSVGFNFTDSYNNIRISPQVGYSFSNFFMLGMGVSYSHYKNKDYDNKTNYLGANINARIFPFRYLTAFVQPEIQHRWGTSGHHKSKTSTFGTCLVGGGIAIPVGFGNFIAEVYYDVLQNRYTPHGKNIGYSVGYSFAF